MTIANTLNRNPEDENSNEYDSNAKSSNEPSKNTKELVEHVELIRALTPVAIAIIGGIVGLYAIHQVQGQELTAAMGLAGTAMAGASGLAQSNRSE